ncbi:DUF1995 family protein [Thermocoleostomius sinensis]|jgi:hypothetical protein|uniref:DUF1995 family protein n=1 Tax=Thermocoleostomius sinensis A174 TaxID=2016057 RepID=A0A9E9C3C1_9CYAN|nr:DUF1995 family protein [Thermocoleostomius sinensis]WAL58816.1 DUF1995 family protein [Thermocoleostomius sinensis A174]
MPLPQSLEEAISQAQVSTKAAIADGRGRLQVELLFPELKVMPVAQQFLPAFEDLGNKLRVYFPDAGAAALARRDWGEKPYAIRGISDMNAAIQPDEEMLLFVEPSSVEVQAVEQLCQEALDRSVVLLNPRMEDIAIIGIGYAGRQLRERFLNTFESCYYIRPLDGAAVFRAYPSPWQVWVEKGDTYELLAETPSKPVGEALDRLLAGENAESSSLEGTAPRRRGLLASMQQFLRALSQ